MPRRKPVADPTNPVQAREYIAKGLGWFFAHKPLTMWPLLLILAGSNGTVWVKALTDDTVSIQPVGEVRQSSILPQAMAASDRTFVADSAWTIWKEKGRYSLRVTTPKGNAYDVDFPALEKMR